MRLRPNAILETALYAEDLDAADAFYGGLLGLEPLMREEGRHVFYRCGEGVLLVFNPKATATAGQTQLPVPTHGAQGPGHLCFRASAEEIAVWRETFEAEGLEIDADFQWPNGARSLYLRDPAGNSVEFAEAKLWGLPA